MFKQLKPAVIVFVLLTLLTGVIYPAIVTVAAMAFPGQAGGSVIERDGKPVGSVLIGQPFTDAKYFWPRPSATSPAYNAAGGSGSNLSTTNPALVDAVKQRIAALHAADPTNTTPIPVDLVTASASGLDPHISPAAAEYQLGRVAKARQIDPAKLRQMVEAHTQSRGLGLFGEPGVNVVQLNLALDGR